MALPRVPVYPSPSIDVTRAEQAFGNRALPKLNRELAGSSEELRLKAVFTLTDMLHNPENITKAIEEGVPAALHRLLRDGSPVIRARTAEVVTILASHSIGRSSILKNEMIPTLALLFSDDHFEVRFNSHAAVEMCSRIRQGAVCVVTNQLVSQLVEKTKCEEDALLKGVILDTLHWCLNEDTEQALVCSAMGVFTALLTHPLTEIRSKAARNVMELSFPLEGKRQACAEGTVPKMVQLLGDTDCIVRAQAAGALMSIAVTTEGKYCAIKCGALEGLNPLMEDQSTEVRLNAIKCLTLLSEAPEGRVALQHVVPRLETVSREDLENISRAANTAIQVITWRP